MKSILSKVWLSITSLVLIILLIIWLYQISLLEKFYIKERTDILLNEGKKITSLISITDNQITFSEDVIAEINSFKSSFNAKITIVDSQTKILFSHPAEQYFKTNFSVTNPNEFHFENIIAHVLNNPELLSSLENYAGVINQNFKNTSKRSFIIVKIPINKDTNVLGNIILTSPVAPIKEATSILRKQLSIISVISILIATLLAFLLAKLFTKPILKITETSKKIAHGDFTANVILNSKDEIRLLGDTINNMSTQLGQIEKFRRDFIANTSHELKTPISLIKAYAELVKDVDGEDKRNRDEHLQVILDESNRLTNMVEDILYLSQMEAGYYKPNYAQFSLKETINRVIEKLSFFGDKKNIMLTLEWDNENTTICADEEKIYQIFLNSINNAISHSYENGEVKIKITSMDTHLRIEIKDQGKGIPKEDLPYIWDRFYKVDKSRKRDDSGTGLGMAIVKNILEAHNFKYGIESELNNGTLVWIEIKR